MLGSQDLHADLRELAHPALLRTLVAEHRPDVIEPLDIRAAMHLMLNIRARDRCGALRAQCQRATLPIEEGIHLLRDDVGSLTDAAREELGAFEDRRPDLTETMALEDGPRGVLHEMPASHLLWQDVARPFHRFDHRTHPGARSLTPGARKSCGE